MISWRKSRFSGTSGNCVEIGWQKSSFSSNGGNCLEVAHAPVGVLVRDSKNISGPTLAFPTNDWRGFLAGL